MLSWVCQCLLLCRVNLIGGSQANGTATDTAAVFTPAKAANKELYMYNLTLPHGFFSRSPLGATDVLKHGKLIAVKSKHAAVPPLGCTTPYDSLFHKIVAVSASSGMMSSVDK